MITHADIINRETPIKHIVELGFDNVGLCVVHWHLLCLNMDSWEFVRKPISNISWKSRCTIMLINDIELRISLEDTNKFSYDNLCFTKIR